MFRLDKIAAISKADACFCLYQNGLAHPIWQAFDLFKRLLTLPMVTQPAWTRYHFSPLRHHHFCLLNHTLCDAFQVHFWCDVVNVAFLCGTVIHTS